MQALIQADVYFNLVKPRYINHAKTFAEVSLLSTIGPSQLLVNHSSHNAQVVKR